MAKLLFEPSTCREVNRLMHANESLVVLFELQVETLSAALDLGELHLHWSLGYAFAPLFFVAVF